MNVHPVEFPEGNLIQQGKLSLHNRSIYHTLAGGDRSENVSRTRVALCYVWTYCLGQSGRVLAEELGVSPQAVYAASSRVERDGGLDSKALERWCR